MMLLTTGAEAHQVVEYSIYDEFGDIMHNSPGMLVQNGQYPGIEIEQAANANLEIEQFRYHSGRFNQVKKNNLTSYVNNQYGEKPVWKFRPLDKDKDKKIIIVEDKPVRRLQMPPQVQPQVQFQPQAQPQVQGHSPYSSQLMMPMMQMTPMMPMATPYMAPPVSPLISPGMFYRYPYYSY